MPGFGFSQSLITALVKLLLYATKPLTFGTHTAGSFQGGPPQGQGQLWGPAWSALPLVQIQLAQVLNMTLSPVKFYFPLVSHVPAVIDVFPVAN